MPELPSWAAKHRARGVEVRRRGAAYYAYRYTSVWDRQAKRPRRRTLEYLGRVTPTGLVPPKHKQPRPLGAILEYGNLALLRHVAQPLAAPVAEHFPDVADSLLAAAALKLAYRPPLKNLQFRHETSWSHRWWRGAALSPNAVTGLLRDVGVRWEAQRGVFAALAERGGYFAFDMTQVFSEAEAIPWLEKGYHSGEGWPDQFNLVLIHRLGLGPHPVFLKLLPGSLRDATTLRNALLESGLKQVLLVGDKGVYARQNLEAVEAVGGTYLFALKRNHAGLRYGAETAYRHYLAYRDRYVWWRELPWRRRRVLVFLDKTLRAAEETALLNRVRDHAVARGSYERTRDRLGTLALVTNAALSPAQAYTLYKQRVEIELAFDALKNTIEADKTYLRSRESVAGYFFVCFLSLYLYARILNHLRLKQLVDKVSVEDALTQLSKVYTVSIEGRDVPSEVPRKVRDLVQHLALPGLLPDT